MEVIEKGKIPRRVKILNKIQKDGWVFFRAFKLNTCELLHFSRKIDTIDLICLYLLKWVLLNSDSQGGVFFCQQKRPDLHKLKSGGFSLKTDFPLEEFQNVLRIKN